MGSPFQRSGSGRLLDSLYGPQEQDDEASSVYTDPDEAPQFDINVFATSNEAAPGLQRHPSIKPGTPGKPDTAHKKGWLQLTRKQAMLRDKVSFVYGLSSCMLSAYCLTDPRAFLKLFIIKSALLLGFRWCMYRLKRWHYYLLEFCYLCIALGIVHIVKYPDNAVLYKLTISLYTGILTGAILATRNSFVLHSVDKLTSLAQHILPAVAAWLLRWKLPQIVQLDAKKEAEFERAGFIELTIMPMGVWLAWAVVYYILVFVLAERKVKERGYATMFSLQTKDKGPLSSFVFSFKSRYVQYAAYLCVHGSCCFVGCVTNNVWWHSKTMHTAYIALVTLVSMWNGACFYFDVFPEKYFRGKRAAEGHPPFSRQASLAKDE